MTQDTVIYEFKNAFFILQRSEVGTETGLIAKLEIPCPKEQMGKAVIGALDKFDEIPPGHDRWDYKKLNAQLCAWLGAKGVNSLTKNSRMVQVIRDGDKLEILPFDNHTKQPWYGPMIKDCGFRKEKIFAIPSSSSFETIGKFISDAFEIATYHRERKDARYGQK